MICGLLVKYCTHSSDSTVNVLCSKDIKWSSESTTKFGFALDGCPEFFSFFNSTVTTSWVKRLITNSLVPVHT